MMFNLHVEQDNPNLRSELDRIVCVYVGDSVGQQIPMIAALMLRFGHDIRLEAEAIPNDARSWKYTCFQHAFELVDPPKLIVKIANLNREIYPNAEFVTFLATNVLSAVVPPDQVADDDVVVYSSEGKPMHAGRCRSGRVVSKWGSMHLWQHRLFEVPLRYGSTVHFYRSISREESVDAFIEYAESKLGRAQIDSLRTCRKEGVV
jgi:hypothetical protein